MQAQYLGEADGKWGSVVMINGLESESTLGEDLLASSRRNIPGVTMIDRSGEICEVC